MLRRLVSAVRQVGPALITIAVVLIAAGPFRLFEGLELATYDAWFGLRGPQPADSRIVIIGVDEPSIRQIGRWPWDRAVHGRLLDRLQEADVVAFDIILAEPSQKPGDDEALAAAIRQHGRVVLSTFIRIDQYRDQFILSPQRPTDLLLQAVREGKHRHNGQGTVNTPSMEDGVVRAYVPIDADTFGEPYPSLALAAIMMQKGISPDQMQGSSSGTAQVGDLLIERDRDGQMLINYAGEPGTFLTYSYADVLNGRVSPDVFRGKIVFVGATAFTLKDDFLAPFAKDSSAGQLMPGVEIQASAAATMLNGTYFSRADHSTNILITLVLGLIVLLFSRRLKPLWGGLALLGFAGGYVVLVYIAWSQYRFWLDSVTPAVGALLVFSVQTLENYLREEAEKRRVRNMFGRYVSHNVVNELLQNPEMQQLGGKRFTLTIMFSDIRGFTSFSEQRDPQEVVQRINDYCKDMVDLIYKHGGTLDKYMGDGIMAYFGAPIPQEDHAERALRCAHEMREKMKDLHKVWVEQGLQPFKIGVGLNSGEVIAGNIGHPDRVEYSLIGSAVNLAARLEGMTKEYAKSEYGGIVFSELTCNAAPKAVEEYKPTEVGEVDVRGMTRKVRIFTM
jgi:adenylate cyclase